ncbi:MAG: hypothetical protein ABMA13_07425 [Chthoniobacteraceae bacterium]
MKLPLILLVLSLPAIAHARLGENETQAKTRYGAAVPELIGPNEKPLMPGAKELAYNFEGWRIRAAYVGGVTHRIEYIKLENSQPKPISEAEIEAVLAAEAGKYKWREEKPRTGYDSLNKLQTAFEGRKWERTDHALGSFKLNLVLTLESRDAEKLEKKAVKAAGGTPAPGAKPKF